MRQWARWGQGVRRGQGASDPGARAGAARLNFSAPAVPPPRLLQTGFCSHTSFEPYKNAPTMGKQCISLEETPCFLFS